MVHLLISWKDAVICSWLSLLMMRRAAVAITSLGHKLERRAKEGEIDLSLFLSPWHKITCLNINSPEQHHQLPWFSSLLALIPIEPWQCMAIEVVFPFPTPCYIRQRERQWREPLCCWRLNPFVVLLEPMSKACPNWQQGSSMSFWWDGNVSYRPFRSNLK